LLKEIGQYIVAKFRKNKVILKDSWTGIGHAETFSYLDLDIKYLYFKNPIKDPVHGKLHHILLFISCKTSKSKQK